ncbi:MAG: hypothetical protein ACKV22_35735 [Bryobacteraceae bacterium]
MPDGSKVAVLRDRLERTLQQLAAALAPEYEAGPVTASRPLAVCQQFVRPLCDSLVGTADIEIRRELEWRLDLRAYVTVSHRRFSRIWRQHLALESPPLRQIPEPHRWISILDRGIDDFAVRWWKKREVAVRNWREIRNDKDAEKAVRDVSRVLKAHGCEWLETVRTLDRLFAEIGMLRDLPPLQWDERSDSLARIGSRVEELWRIEAALRGATGDVEAAQQILSVRLPDLIAARGLDRDDRAHIDAFHRNLAKAIELESGT